MRMVPLLLVLLFTSGCTFERRPDRAADGNLDDEPGLADSSLERVMHPADSVLVVARLYREALEVGDLSRALSFLHPGAALYNDAAALLPPGSSAGEVLLQELRLRQEGMTFEVLDSEVTLLGDAALVLKRYRMLDQDGSVDAQRPAGPAEPTADRDDVALETIILVRSPSGWRIRHLHRSAAYSN